MFRIRIGLLCMIILMFGSTVKVAMQHAIASEQQEVQKTDDAMCVPMGEIILGSPNSLEQKKSPVNFPHNRHFGYDCKTCHHKWKGDTQIRTCTTSGCHDLKESPKKPTKYLAYSDSTIKYFKYAFHTQCIGCHKEIQMKRTAMEMSYRTLETQLPETGPTGCVKCHPRQ